MQKILIIDDDIIINNMLNSFLTENGYCVLSALNGNDGLNLLNKKPDLVLLDLMLPDISGESLLNNLKDIPVIVLSAKNNVYDKINLLNYGACDYMTKPFDLNELLARIKVQLRKKIVTNDDFIIFENLSLSKNNNVLFINKNEIHLTKTEHEILKKLMLNCGNVVKKNALIDAIFKLNEECTEESLKVHIHNLRKKIGLYDNKNHINSIWGIGFILK